MVERTIPISLWGRLGLRLWFEVLGGSVMPAGAMEVIRAEKKKVVSGVANV